MNLAPIAVTFLHVSIAATSANWLICLERIFRSADGAGESLLLQAYAQAVRLGAPQAIQLTDKWHLLKNLSEALQRLLARHLAVHHDFL